MERFKPRKSAVEAGVTTLRPSSFKRMSNNGVEAPFDERVFELPITTTTGQFFDFKFDLYYANSKGFPFPSGFSGRGTSPSKTSTQFLAFRIVKRTDGIEQISPVVAKLRMIGVLGDPTLPTDPVITFGTY